MATKNVRSIEEQVEDWCKAQLRSIKYYTKTESINSEIGSIISIHAYGHNFFI